MRPLFILVGHLLATIARLLRAGGARAVVAERVLLKQELLAVRRSRHRAPNFSVRDRFLVGLWALFLGGRRIPRAAIVPRPSTLLSFHDSLKKWKYRLPYTHQRLGEARHQGAVPGTHPDHLHGFPNLSFLTMCPTVVINLVVGAMDKRGKFELGDRIDRRCRWVFPLAYFGLLLVMVGVSILFF